MDIRGNKRGGKYVLTSVKNSPGELFDFVMCEKFRIFVKIWHFTVIQSNPQIFIKRKSKNYS